MQTNSAVQDGADSIVISQIIILTKDAFQSCYRNNFARSLSVFNITLP